MGGKAGNGWSILKRLKRLLQFLSRNSRYAAERAKEGMLLFAGLGAVCMIFSAAGIGCPIKWFTGVSCAGCGMTRAVFCAVKLQFGKAFYYHPLVFMMPFCVLLFLFWEKIPTGEQRGIVRAIAACFAAVYLARLFCSGHQVVSVEIEDGILARIWHSAAQEIF